MSAGMTVDEIERRAKAVLADDWLPENHREKVLARFVLLAVPLIREAELWQRQIIGERTSYDLRLEAAIDTLRAALGKP